MKIICVAGARPNFIKIAPLMEAFNAKAGIDPFLVHTGQHYDEKMSDLFFRQLGIPEPDIDLGIGSASHAVQTAEIMKAFEPVVQMQKPDAVLVVGDVNSTIACGLVAAKLGVTLIHVEAGLRSFDRSMPEEINRILTDAISDYLFVTEISGVENLKNEGIHEEKIHLVGNVMIDTLLKHKARSDASRILKTLGVAPQSYAVLTMHRPSNVDDREVLDGIFDALEIIQTDLPIVFPIHPRTRNNIEAFDFSERIADMRNLKLTEPVGYLDFLKLMSDAKLVLTDSGGIQEETTILKVPCITMRENTERPVTVEVSANALVGTGRDDILSAYRRAVASDLSNIQTPDLWDGRAAQRIAQILAP